jgi:MFS family permease
MPNSSETLIVETQNKKAGVKQTFSALQHHNYRLWFSGQMVSLMGTWMQSTAQGYLIYQLTSSSAFLGYVSFAAGLPSWIFTLFAGVMGDWMSRRKLLVYTQIAMMTLAFALSGLVFTGVVMPFHILIMAFMLGIANAFDAPTRQAFVVELVEREDLTNAIALNSIMFNAAVVVGPTVAGFVYDWLGAGWCFAINGISFIAVIIALLLMRFKRTPRRQGATPSTPTDLPTPAGRAGSMPSTPTDGSILAGQTVSSFPMPRSVWKDIRVGFQFVLSNHMVAFLILGLGLITMFGMSIMTLIPAWSAKILGGDVRTNGLLLSARGVGALLGGLLIAALAKRGVKGKLWTIGSFIFPVVMFAFALVNWLPLSMLALVGIGACFMLLANTTNALVQTRMPDEIRSRVMSIYTLVFFGAMPIGSLIVGNVAAAIGEQRAVLIDAVIMAIFAVVIFLKVPQLRKLA